MALSLTILDILCTALILNFYLNYVARFIIKMHIQCKSSLENSVDPDSQKPADQALHSFQNLIRVHVYLKSGFSMARASALQIRVCNLKILYVFLNQNTSC